MSSQTAGLISLAEVLYQANHCIVGSTVFLIYDYVITFGREVEMFWTAKLTGASVLFFANRYISLLFNMLGLAQFSHFSDTSCPLFIKAFASISYSQYIIWAAFSALRAYALCRQRILSAFVFLLALVPAGINYTQFSFGLTGYNSPTFGCFTETSMTAVMARKHTYDTSDLGGCPMVIADRRPCAFLLVLIVSRTCIIAADAILILITWSTLGRRSAFVTDLKHKNRWSLTNVLLRDGTIYFVILLVLNVLHLAFTLSSVFGHLLSNISIFTNEIVAVLVSRFLLDLQAASRRSLKLNSDDPLHLSTDMYEDTPTLTFARVIGSLSSSFVLSGVTESDGDQDSDTVLEEDSPDNVELDTVAHSRERRRLHADGTYTLHAEDDRLDITLENDVPHTHTPHDVAELHSRNILNV